MKIVILASQLKHGGASVNGLGLAKGLSQKGHEVIFVCAGEKSGKHIKDGYKVITLSRKFKNPFFHYFNPLLLYKLKKIINEFRPDIINVHNINLQTFSLFALFYSIKYPMIWTLHDVWAVCMTGWPNPPDCEGMLDKCRKCPSWPNLITYVNRLIKEFVFRKARIKVVVPSQWMASVIYTSELGKKNVSHIRYGIDKRIFNPNSELAVNDLRFNRIVGKKILLFSGGKRLVGELPAYRKGWNYLFEALNIVSQKRDDIHLLYIGDKITIPPDFPFPVTFVEDANQKNMKYYYNLSDIFILPTLGDNSPLTILEAMACKLPVVATEIGGIPEMVIHNKTGLLCKPRNENSLAESIDFLLSNPKIGVTIAEQAYEEYRKKYSFEQMIDNYEHIYSEEIVRRNKSKK